MEIERRTENLHPAPAQLQEIRKRWRDIIEDEGIIQPGAPRELTNAIHATRALIRRSGRYTDTSLARLVHRELALGIYLQIQFEHTPNSPTTLKYPSLGKQLDFIETLFEEAGNHFLLSYNPKDDEIKHNIRTFCSDALGFYLGRWKLKKVADIVRFWLKPEETATKFKESQLLSP